MADDPILERVLLVNEPDFRLVRHELADGHVGHVLEVKDTPDAMGTERWRNVAINGMAMQTLFRYLVRLAEKETA